MTITTVINTNVQSIDRVLATDMPVLLAFWRPTTPMTPAQEESLERLAQSYAGRAILARVDADAEPPLRVAPELLGPSRHRALERWYRRPPG